MGGARESGFKISLGALGTSLHHVFIHTALPAESCIGR